MEVNKNQWTPSEVRKTITLITGIILFGFALYLIFNNISAQGDIDITTPVIKGKLNTKSAGLFIALFGLILIVISNVKSKESDRKDNFGFLKNNTTVITALLCLILILLIAIYTAFPASHFIIDYTLGAAIPIACLSVFYNLNRNR